MDTSSDQSQPPRSREQSLGRKTARGVMWMTLQGFGLKGANTVSTFILMALLLEEHWGIYALAMSMRSVLDVTGRVGMRQVLVHRQKHFNRWATPAFWMCVSIGCLAAVLLTGAAPVMAAVYGEPDLVWLMMILASSSPFLASGMVPQAKLMSQMRFKAIAGIEFGTHLATIALTLLLAWAGLGAYSFFIPLPFMEIGRSVSFWMMSRPRIRMTPQVRRWKYLFSDTSSLFVTNLLQKFVTQADYLILGIFHPTAIVGIYAVAYRMSAQSMTLVSGNLTQAMLPALSKLQEDNRRQVRAFLRAGTLLCALYAPVGLLQAATCEPILRLIYGDKWEQSIPVLQILSMFIIIRVMNGPAMSLLRAQGRFKLDMVLQIINTLSFVAVVLFACAFWSVKACALAVSLVAITFGPTRIYLGIRPIGGTIGDVLSIYVRPVLAGVVAFAIAYASRWLIPIDLPDLTRYVSEIVIITLLGMGLYAAILRWTMPALWDDLWNQAKNVNPLQRKRRKQP